MAGEGGRKSAYLNKNLNLLECLGNRDSGELDSLWVNIFISALIKMIANI